MVARFCGNCGTPRSEGTAFCGKCGTPFAEESSQVTDDKTPSSGADQWLMPSDTTEEVLERQEIEEKHHQSRSRRYAVLVVLVAVFAGYVFAPFEPNPNKRWNHMHDLSVPRWVINAIVSQEETSAWDRQQSERRDREARERKARERGKHLGTKTAKSPTRESRVGKKSRP